MKRAGMFHKSSARFLGVFLVFVLTLGVLVFTGAKAAKAEDSMPEETSSEVSEPSDSGSSESSGLRRRARLSGECVE